mmetsp:Transcript_41688/g.99995  ORF Transcript_41688/g.99995 Transcript_41688/m.99995 type:complete len:411 (+) Transcript_41688:69-1301(+)
MPVVRVQFTEVEVIELPVVAGPDHPSVVVAAEEDADVDGDVNTAAGGGSKIDRKTTSSTTTVVTTQRYTDSSSIALGWNAERRTKISVNTYEEQRHYENEIRHRRRQRRRRFGHSFGQRRRRSPHQRRHGRARLQLQRLSRSVRKRILRRNGFDTSDIDESEGNSNEQEGEEDSSSSLSASGEDDEDGEEGGGEDIQPKKQQKLVNTLSVDRFSSDGSTRSRISRSSAPVDVAPRLPRRSDPSPEKYSSPQPPDTVSTEVNPLKPSDPSSSLTAQRSSMICAEDIFSCTAPDEWFGGVLLCGSTTTVDDIYDTLVGVDQKVKEYQVSDSRRIDLGDNDALGSTVDDNDDDEAKVMDAMFQNQMMSSSIHCTKSRSQQRTTSHSRRLTKKPVGYYNAGRAYYTTSENRWKQ